MASGFVTAWLSYNVVTTLTWMPALFWASTRLMQERHIVWVAATALLVGLVLLGGHPETQFLIGGTWGLYCLYTLFLARRQHSEHGSPNIGRLLSALAAAALLGTKADAGPYPGSGSYLSRASRRSNGPSCPAARDFDGGCVAVA